MWDRWVIFSVILETNEVIKIDLKGDNDFLLTIDESKIETVGKAALGKFLQKLQVYKSIASKEGVDLFNKYSVVSDEFLKIRDIVIKNKSARGLEV